MKKIFFIIAGLSMAGCQPLDKDYMAFIVANNGMSRSFIEDFDTMEECNTFIRRLMEKYPQNFYYCYKR